MAREPEKELDEAEAPRVKGDQDFAGVARDRLGGPADYDESAGNELQRPADAEPVESETDPGDEDR